jgi:hypothetical protein
VVASEREKTVLSFVRNCIDPYLVRESGEALTHNDDHLTLTMSGGTFRLTIEEEE